MRLRVRAACAIVLVTVGVAYAFARQASQTRKSNPQDEAKLLADLKAPAGFNVTIFASPPDISYPTCITAAPTGEVFVGIDQNGSLDQKSGRGRVVRCIDTDGDGRADRFNVFAEMDSPRGLVYDAGTLYVLHPPFLTAYYDDNGDGVADRSEDLITGLAHDLKFRGADHTTNGIQLGIDGWIYIACGDYGALDAVGKDGTHLQLHGGGVLRVRTDGSGLEQVSRGQRNIYDVAIDPLMNIFTCDNTNDGGGWNVRLSHVFQTANFGYPTLFVNFPEEIVQPLNDYGGGAPTGSLFVDEPGLPNPFGHALYTCEWGRGAIFRHPLTSSGAGYTQTPREQFVHLSSPTDMDVDGQSHIFLSSWKGAVFNYAGPNVGYVARLDPKDNHQPAFPDLKKASNDELLKLLASASAKCRLHTQREILRRGDKSAFVAPLEKLASSDAPMPARVAAIFTLKQMLGSQSDATLLKLEQDPAVREFAIRALIDDKPHAKELALDPFERAIDDANPRVRLQAAIVLGRIGKIDAADKLISHATDPDPLVSHASIQALIALHAIDPCFKALDTGSPGSAPALGRVLQAFHEPHVVDGLIARLSTAKETAVRHAIVSALCRLYTREADWDGSWWGTRPDTSGPYFKPVKWDQSDKIVQALRGTLNSDDADALRPLLIELQRNKVDLPEATAMMLKLAQKDPAFRASTVELLSNRPNPSPQVVALLEQVASSEQEDGALRGKALGALHRAASNPANFEAALRAFIAAGKSPKPSDEMRDARLEFIRDGRNLRRLDQFVKLTESSDPAARELAYAVLVAPRDNRRAGLANTRATIDKTIEAAWSKPQTSADLLRAIGQTANKRFADQVKTRLSDEHPEVRRAAEYAAGELKIPVAAASKQPLISTMKYEQVVSAAIQTQGDAKLGAELFQRQGCVNCHTTASNQTPKGPFLGDIAARYSKADLLESVLKPNAKIAQGFQTHWYDTKDGNRRIGFVSKESGDSVELHDATGAAVVIPKSDIVKQGVLPTSIMPEGLADNLTLHDLASLLAYLESLKGK